MNRKLDERAKAVAQWPYTIKISKDITIDGKEVILACHPELNGCMAQGEEVEEAVKNLKEVTHEYILSLLEDHVPIPVPSSRLTTKGHWHKTIEGTVTGNKSFMDILSDVVQPSIRQDISTVDCVSCPSRTRT